MNCTRSALAALILTIPLVIAGCLRIDIDDLPAIGGGNNCCGNVPIIPVTPVPEKLAITVGGIAYTMAPAGDEAGRLHLTAENRWRLLCENALEGPDTVTLQLPPEVHAGYVYTEETLCCMELLTLQLVADDAMSVYAVNRQYPFTLTVTEWGGPGGRFKATFSGTLFNASTGCAKTVSGGSIDVIIH